MEGRAPAAQAYALNGRGPSPPFAPRRSCALAVRGVLAREELLLAPHAPAIARQRTVLPNDPMTGDEDRDWVLRNRPCHGALCAGPIERPRDVVIGPRLASRDGAQRLPDACLKRGPLDIERNVDEPAPIDRRDDQSKPLG